MAEFDVNENSDIYYGGDYWNNLQVVREMFVQKISGIPDGHWFDHFARKSDRTYKRALILNCGNGWVERELFNAGLIAEAVGIDYSDTLLSEARSVAADHGLPLRYVQMNVNSASLPDEEFDLVVNYAAAHHISCIDRAFRQICTLLPHDGWFISFDYVGPHRNQYRSDAWEEAWRLNQQLPDHVRQELHYPHLPTMLHDDPTEAIHSELTVEMLQRYFVVEQFTPLGGAIAYPILTHNARLFSLPDQAEQEKWAGVVLDADETFLTAHPESTLFAYFTAQPNKAALEDQAQLSRWESEEVEREARAAANGGEYYSHTALQAAYIALESEAQESARLRQRCHDLRFELDTIHHSFGYLQVKRFVRSSPIRKIRTSRLARHFEGRAGRTPQ